MFYLTIFSSEIITNLKVMKLLNQKTQLFFLKRLQKKRSKNFEAITGKFSITNSKNIEQILNPELRIYNQPNIVTSEADIKINLLSEYWRL